MFHFTFIPFDELPPLMLLFFALQAIFEEVKKGQEGGDVFVSFTPSHVGQHQVSMAAKGCRSLILRESLFVLWVRTRSSIPTISLLILMTISWLLIVATIVFRGFIKMAPTSKRLELDILLVLRVFAWTGRKGFLSARFLPTGS